MERSAAGDDTALAAWAGAQASGEGVMKLLIRNFLARRVPPMSSIRKERAHHAMRTQLVARFFFSPGARKTNVEVEGEIPWRRATRSLQCRLVSSHSGG
jgi:hypothetical protein